MARELGAEYVGRRGFEDAEGFAVSVNDPAGPVPIDNALVIVDRATGAVSRVSRIDNLARLHAMTPVKAARAARSDLR